MSYNDNTKGGDIMSNNLSIAFKLEDIIDTIAVYASGLKPFYTRLIEFLINKIIVFW